VSLGAEELKPRKYGFLQAIYFKRKQSYTSKRCLREILTAEEFSQSTTGDSWNWALFMLGQLQKELGVVKGDLSLLCYSAEI
jgi:hypothetical protein